MDEKRDNLNPSQYLMCETKAVYRLLIAAAGMMGAYTLKLRGNVFCNAQTGNFALMAVALGSGDWRGALYYIVPISAYLMGAILSEWLPKEVRRLRLFRWDTWLVAFEILALVAVGFIPLTVTHHVVQVIINFICSMQYNTFRQAERVPMATTFCTNHLRQTGIHLVKYWKNGDDRALERLRSHVVMISCFVAGGIVESFACGFLWEKAVWLAVVPLLTVFAQLAWADLGYEHKWLERIPAGH